MHPALMLVYLPHLDYNLQRLGADDSRVVEDVRQVDQLAGRLIRAAQESDAEVLVVSEYGINTVERPIHLNRLLRDAGLLRVRREPLGWETLDCGASRAFAVADHQAAHVYVRDAADISRVRALLERVEGVERVLGRDEQAALELNHERGGDLVCIAERKSWFTYYFWLNDAVAPDFARTVDIHRKPGYDPVELLVDPALRFPRLRLGVRLTQKLLGFRYYMDLIGLDASIVKGSHGRIPDLQHRLTDGPVLICSSKGAEQDDFRMTDVRNLILRLQFGG